MLKLLEDVTKKNKEVSAELLNIRARFKPNIEPKGKRPEKK
jgi:hypothetical protein